MLRGKANKIRQFLPSLYFFLDSSVRHVLREYRWEETEAQGVDVEQTKGDRDYVADSSKARFPPTKKIPERQTGMQVICAEIHQHCELS